MQEVQTFNDFLVPFTLACTRWMFGFQVRLVFFFDQGTLLPNPGDLAQISQTAATGTPQKTKLSFKVTLETSETIF